MFAPRLLAAAAALSLMTGLAHAENHDLVIDLQGDAQDGFSASLSLPDATQVVHQLSGSFTDTFTFVFSGSGVAEFALNHGASQAQAATQQIVFTGVTLNGVAGELLAPVVQGNSVFRFAFSPELVPVNGNFQLVVEGYAGLLNSSNQPISASYSGTLNVSAVPEPATYALLLGGLGLVGWTKRRRGA